MPHNEFRYIALKRFVAAHPVGSGIEVTYEIGDAVPAGEWGRAASMMVESGKLTVQAYEVRDPGDDLQGAVPGSPLPSTEKTVAQVNAETDPASEPDVRPGQEWPKRTAKKAFFELSDGSVIYGRDKAIAEQNALEAPAPAPSEENESQDEAAAEEVEGASEDDGA